MDKKQNLTRTLIFVGITFLITYAYCFLLLRPVINGESLSGIPSLKAQLLVVAVMFFPALGVVLTRLITKEGFRNHFLKLNLKRNLKYYLLAWFGPGVLTLLGGAVYFAIFPSRFDFSCGYLRTMMEATGTSVQDLPLPLGFLMLVSMAQGLFLAPVMNFIPCFGEEWGWRGYLLPKLAAGMKPIPTALLSGVIWGLWHAPLTMMGHNYGVGYPSFPYAGIAMMCLFCISAGIFLSFITMKTNSCIPAILAHGAINGIAAIGIYFTEDGGNPFLGPAPTGILAMLPLLVLAVFLLIRMHKEKGTA